MSRPAGPLAPILALILALVGLTGPARAQALVTDLSDYHVAITSSFTGTQLLLFGSIGRNIDPASIDLIVVVRGPPQRAVIRRREREWGIFVNRDEVVFDGPPGYYQVASTRPLDTLASTQLLARNQIGLNYLRLDPVPPAVATAPLGAPMADFRAALVRAKTREGLYREDIGSVTFVSPSLFRQTIRIPSNVPIGDYRVEVYLVSDGDILAAQSSPLFIGKTGTEREIFVFAHRQPLAFGLIAVALALASGWAAGEIFRKT